MLQPPANLAKYRTVMLDPPWRERGGGRIKRGADRHYPLMEHRAILETVVRCSPWRQMAGNAHMYLWVTNNFLVEGLWLMDALGFKYKTNVCWTKEGRIGLGQYFRGRHELMLFGTRGRRPTEPRTERRDIPSVIEAPRGRHSQKPEEAYQLVESRSKGPYLEIFARTRRPGWCAWGNEL